MVVHTENKNPAPVVVSSTTRLDWYRQMCRIEVFERAVYGLSKAGLIAGTAHLYIGMGGRSPWVLVRPCVTEISLPVRIAVTVTQLPAAWISTG